MKETAHERAFRMCEEKEKGLWFNHIKTALESGGVVHVEPSLAYAIAPYDPLDGEPDTTAAVLFCTGSGYELGKHAKYLEKLGYTHVLWTRGFKKGTKRLQKYPIGHFAELAIRLNKHGKGME